MKYKLINLKTNEEHLCEKITIGVFDYYVNDETIKQGDKWFDGTNIRNDYSLHVIDGFDRKVIATNNPNINIPQVVGEVEMIANTLFESHSKNIMSPQFEMRRMFIEGYNKSQETHSFSEEDMIEFGIWLNTYYVQHSVGCCENIKTHTIHKTKELIQIWKEQRIKTLYFK